MIRHSASGVQTFSCECAFQNVDFYVVAYHIPHQTSAVLPRDRRKLFWGRNCCQAQLYRNCQVRSARDSFTDGSRSREILQRRVGAATCAKRHGAAGLWQEILQQGLLQPTAHLLRYEVQYTPFVAHDYAVRFLEQKYVICTKLLLPSTVGFAAESSGLSL